MSAPTIHTDVLILRPMTMEDFPAYAAFWASDRARHMGGPKGEQSAWFWFCHDAAQWALLGHGALMIVRQDSGETVGQVAINSGPLFPEVELGWLLYEGHEGQGFAAEAALRMRDWAFANLPVQTLVSYIDPDNHAAIALAKHIEAELDVQAKGRDPIDQVWRHFRPEVPKG